MISTRKVTPPHALKDRVTRYAHCFSMNAHWMCNDEICTPFCGGAMVDDDL